MNADPCGRLSVSRSADFAAPVDQVWAVVGSFGGLAGWMPGIRSIVVEGAGIGMVRTCSTRAGPFVEQLVAADDVSHDYTILSGPLPVSRYRARLAVSAFEPDRSRLAWSSTFDAAAGIGDEEARAMVAEIYGSGLTALERRFGRA